MEDTIQAIEYAKTWQAIALPRTNKKYPPTAVRAVSEDNIARAYLQLGDYSKAEELSRSAIRNGEQAFGADNPMIREILAGLGNTLNLTGDYQEALKIHLRSLELFGRTTQGKEYKNFALAQTYSDLGNVYSNLGRWKKSEEAYNAGLTVMSAVSKIRPEATIRETSLAATETVRGRNDRMVTMLMNNLGSLLRGGALRGSGDVAQAGAGHGRDHQRTQSPGSGQSIAEPRRRLYGAERVRPKPPRYSAGHRGSETTRLPWRGRRWAWASWRSCAATWMLLKGSISSHWTTLGRALGCLPSSGARRCFRLVRSHCASGKYSQAERYAGQCLELIKVPDTERELYIAEAYEIMAGASLKRGDLTDAIERSRKSIEIRQRLRDHVGGDTITEGVEKHLALLEQGRDANVAGGPARLSAEAFEAAQLPLRSTTAAALQSMGQRAAAGSPEARRPRSLGAGSERRGRVSEKETGRWSGQIRDGTQCRTHRSTAANTGSEGGRAQQDQEQHRRQIPVLCRADVDQRCEGC